MSYWYNNYDKIIQNLDKTLPFIPTDILEKIKKYLDMDYYSISYIPNFKKSFQYDKTTTAIGGCNPNAIEDIIKNTKEFINTYSLPTIKFTIIITLNSINHNNEQIDNYFADLDEIMDKYYNFEYDHIVNEQDYNIFIQKYLQMTKLMYDNSKLIICSAIFIWFVQKKHESLNHYFRKLYDYIHTFRIATCILHNYHKTEWPDCHILFREDDNLNYHRLNMFIFHACGIKHEGSYNPEIDFEIDFDTYFQDFKKDMESFS